MYYQFACVCIPNLKLHFVCFSLHSIGYDLGWPNEKKDYYHLVVYLKFDETRGESNLCEELVKRFDGEIIKFVDFRRLTKKADHAIRLLDAKAGGHISRRIDSFELEQQVNFENVSLPSSTDDFKEAQFASS